jgi:signal transduction histidine kinase
MNLKRPTILILSSDPAFSRQVTTHWPAATESPDFIVLNEDLCRELQRDTYDLAIADVPTGQKRDALIEALASTGKPAIVVHSDSFVRCGIQGAMLQLHRQLESWPDVVGLLGRQILHRCQADVRTREAERLRLAAEAEATLGRYMVEMRHTVNNALTSVLGNAELLLLEPGLPARVLAQADTIRNMALRLHEVFQRFSSIEKELSVVARESGKSSGSGVGTGVSPVRAERSSAASA